MDKKTSLCAEMPAPEPLSPELQPYLSQAGFLPTLRHPLVYCVPYFDGMTAWANQFLKFKQDALAKAVAERNWARVLTLFERPYRVDAFSAYSPLMDDRDYWENLAWIYTDSENIEQSYEVWENLLESTRGSREEFMSKDERAFLDGLPDTFQVFRGCKGDFESFDTEDILDLSWSVSPKVAVWFAQRFDTPGFVVKATVSKEDVVGFKNNRNEEEIVVHRDHVRNIELHAAPSSKRSPRPR